MSGLFRTGLGFQEKKGKKGRICESEKLAELISSRIYIHNVSSAEIEELVTQSKDSERKVEKFAPNDGISFFFLVSCVRPRSSWTV